MNDKFQYRLSQVEKMEIAQNLIDILCKNAEITDHTVTFIGNWILTGSDEKRKAFFDVWDIVLKNYMPSSRPILFRSCKRPNDGKIASFTDRLECAKRFSGGNGSLIICDTQEILRNEEYLYKPGQYKHTFYPLVKVLEMAKASGGAGFSERLLRDYTGEREYIMRVDIVNMENLKWVKRDFDLYYYIKYGT